MFTVKTIVPPDLFINRVYSPAGSKFPYGIAMPEDFDKSAPVNVVIILPTDGETTDVCTLQSAMRKGFFYINEKTYSLFGASCVWPIVYVLVQTSRKSSYTSGEIPFAVDLALKEFNVKSMNLLTISRGGYGALQWLNTSERCGVFDKAIFHMPGGDGRVGGAFPAAAVGAGLKCLFVHAVDDTVARPVQSIDMHTKIKELGGDSQLVLYKAGGHEIMVRPMGFDNVKINGLTWSENLRTWPVTEASDFNITCIYDWFCDGAPEPQKDELIFVQGIWRRPDGTVYAKEYQGIDGEKFQG
jgi:hypothetical protein